MKSLRTRYEKNRQETPHGPLRMWFDGNRIHGPFRLIDEDGMEMKETQTLYNGCAPIECTINGKTEKVIAVRYEALNDELGSVILGTVDEDGKIVLNGPRFACAQDPSIFVIRGRTILTFNGYTSENGRITSVRQFFYYLDDLDRPFAIGPFGQKCCRLTDLHNGKIGLFGRKQEWPTMRGQLTYIEIDSLYDLQESISQAKLIGPITGNDCWLGANQLLPLDKAGSYIGILGHIADFDPDLLKKGIEKKRYLATASVYDRETSKVVAMEIIADARHINFKEDAKMTQLGNVIYPGGLVRGNGYYRYRLYGGYGDIRSFWMDLNIPIFDFYESK